MAGVNESPRGSGRLRILNLGCGLNTSDRPEVVNVDWSFYLRLKRLGAGGRLLARALGPERRRRLRTVPRNVVVHNLAKPLPFPDGFADAAYHSHVLEHLDRPLVERFMREVRRVLKPGGVQRIVVPDLEALCRELIAHLDACSDPAERERHDKRVAALLEQAVRRESAATAGRHGAIAALERLVVGDARRRGETHQWMYDWANLTALVERSGFDEVRRVDHRTSEIPGWASYGLDLDATGGERKPGSLYVEARAAEASTATSSSI